MILEHAENHFQSPFNVTLQLCTVLYCTAPKHFSQISRWRPHSWQNDGDATTAQTVANRLMHCLTLPPLLFAGHSLYGLLTLTASFEIKGAQIDTKKGNAFYKYVLGLKHSGLLKLLQTDVPYMLVHVYLFEWGIYQLKCSYSNSELFSGKAHVSTYTYYRKPFIRYPI